MNFRRIFMSEETVEKLNNNVIFVPTELTSYASAELQTQIDADMSVPDPEDKENALASLITNS